MTDLTRLRVSLTKHGAYKIALLLKHFEADDVLNHLAGSLDGVNIEVAQARKNLSVKPNGDVPRIWTRVKQLGEDAIDALVFVAIVFSHHTLMEAMATGALESPFTGKISRGAVLDGKEYTNFSCNIDELGYATRVSTESVSYDLRKLFEVDGINLLVRELLTIKLKAAGWNEENSLEEEISRLSLARVFSVGNSDLIEWLNAGGKPRGAPAELLTKDEDFFSRGEDQKIVPFEFVPGHAERAVTPVNRSASPRVKALRLHNQIQNEMYKFLCAQLGKRCVGTEVETGAGTSVDIVTRVSEQVTFYEIKTSRTVRANIRQAVPQLLEYCYWPNEQRASRLVIVSHLPQTEAGAEYIETLRKRFGVPIFYEQFCLKTLRIV